MPRRRMSALMLGNSLQEILCLARDSFFAWSSLPCKKPLASQGTPCKWLFKRDSSPHERLSPHLALQETPLLTSQETPCKRLLMKFSLPLQRLCTSPRLASLESTRFALLETPLLFLQETPCKRLIPLQETHYIHSIHYKYQSINMLLILLEWCRKKRDMRWYMMNKLKMSYNTCPTSYLLPTAWNVLMPMMNIHSIH